MYHLLKNIYAANSGLTPKAKLLARALMAQGVTLPPNVNALLPGLLPSLGTSALNMFG
jgi:hypothetical protein